MNNRGADPGLANTLAMFPATVGRVTNLWNRELGVAWKALLVVAVVMASLATTIVPAAAHAELIEASPGRSRTVGGEISTIEMQFVGLTPLGDHEVLVIDPLGNVLEPAVLEQDFQKLILDIPTLEVEGIYIVSFKTDGVDGDTETDSYQFTYEVGAAQPEGITFGEEPESTDWVTVVLIAVTALAVVGWLLFVMRRLRSRDGNDTGGAGSEVEHLDELDHEDERLP